MGIERRRVAWAYPPLRRFSSRPLVISQDNFEAFPATQCERQLKNKTKMGEVLESKYKGFQLSGISRQEISKIWNPASFPEINGLLPEHHGVISAYGMYSSGLKNVLDHFLG